MTSLSHWWYSGKTIVTRRRHFGVAMTTAHINNKQINSCRALHEIKHIFEQIEENISDLTLQYIPKRSIFNILRAYFHTGNCFFSISA